MPSDRGQASATSEVEITPAMIDAGVSEYCAGDEGAGETKEEIVTKIFLAMMAARKLDLACRT